jgi:hypothetical protein
VLAARAAANPPKPVPRSIILLFLDGGASQLETFDPKPEAPKEYRSISGAVKTSLPGVLFGAQLPKLATLAHRMSIVRTFVHRDGDHGGATHWIKTGYPWPEDALGKAPVVPQVQPSIGSVVARYRGPVNTQSGVPTYVRVLSNHGGFPGDDATWLGQAFAPFRVGIGRSQGNPMLANMGLKVEPGQFQARRALLQSLDTFNRTLDKSGIMEGLDGFQRQATEVVLGSARQAFDLDREPVAIREAYGPGLGQELLLARRLCEAGAGFVTLNNGYWDHHGGIIPGLEKLCPPLDHAVAAFVEDVKQRGLEKDILLVVTGEFGRTPRINGGPGRDHWAPTNDIVFFGGGLKMGQVIGETDAVAGHVKSRPVTPQDYMATLMHVLGMDLEVQYLHPTGRPTYMLEDGAPLSELL